MRCLICNGPLTIDDQARVSAQLHTDLHDRLKLLGVVVPVLDTSDDRINEFIIDVSGSICFRCYEGEGQRRITSMLDRITDGLTRDGDGTASIPGLFEWKKVRG